MKWHSFRKRKLRIIFHVAYYFKPYNKKTIGADFFSIIIIENGWHHQIMLKKTYDNAGSFFFKKLLSDKDFIKKRIKESRKISDSFLCFCRKELPENLKKRTDKGLLQLLEKI